MSLVTQFLLGRMIGYGISYGRNSACFNRPSDRINPSSSRFGCNPNNLLIDGKVFPVRQSLPFVSELCNLYMMNNLYFSSFQFVTQKFTGSPVFLLLFYRCQTSSLSMLTLSSDVVSSSSFAVPTESCLHYK